MVKFCSAILASRLGIHETQSRFIVLTKPNICELANPVEAAPCMLNDPSRRGIGRLLFLILASELMVDSGEMSAYDSCWLVGFTGTP